ncbi:MAG: TRAP transporter small permease [Candidatus Methylomirabilales bacterium]
MKRVLEYTIGVLLLLMAAITFYQVLARVVLQISSTWSEELARYTYVGMVFLGAAVLVKDDGLIRVTALTDRLGPRAGALLRVLADAVALPFFAVLTWGSWLNARSNWGTYAPTIEWLAIGYVYLVMAAAGVVMLWYLLVTLTRDLRSACAGSRT